MTTHKFLFSLFGLFTIVLLSSCREDTLTNQIDFSTPYTIQDDPNDPIQHHCYEVYQKYGVSVYFNDTIQSTLIGTDHKGKPIYKYETLDLNWDFTSHNGRTVTYKYDYLTKKEDKEKAMRFVDVYLNRVSKSMRPFTIFLTDTIRKITSKEIIKNVSESNFRVLAVSQLTNYTDEQIEALCKNLINASVIEKVKLNTQVTGRFWEISDKSNWYKQYWSPATGFDNNLGITSEYFQGDYRTNKLAPNTIWNEGAYQNSFDSNPNSKRNPNNGWTEEKFQMARTEIINCIGQFGFISGTRLLEHLQAPNKSEDLEFYVETMLDITEAEFKARYGGSTLVMKKYYILKEYIVNTLQVELK